MSPSENITVQFVDEPNVVPIDKVKNEPVEQTDFDIDDIEIKDEESRSLSKAIAEE